MNAHRPVTASSTNAVTVPDPAAPQAPPVPNEIPLVLDRATMAAALTNGTAVPLTSHITSLAHHRDVWWLDDDDAWLQITDQTFASTLDTIHARQG